MKRPYTRVYHEARSDERFEGIWDCDAHLALWLRLLVEADIVWPHTAPIPRSTRRKSLDALVAAGLVEVVGDRYRIHGLDRERISRSNAARDAAGVRWHSDGNADA